MSEPAQHEVNELPRWQQHRFFLLIAGVIGIALFLVSVALSLYNNSGAAQLDFSSPAYQDIRKQARRDTTTVDFAATGKLDKAAYDQFKKMYTERIGKVVDVNSFDAAALSEDSLQLLTDHSTDQPPAQ
ncbi:hypothetical protein IPM09_00040 [Candidatus Saccharibacteria bacterium]|nr:MAG: hypothetical protein IPM09_00040 [Candidatus Saccharibacteria bacterium]